MSKNYSFDYIILGSGPAGRTAAAELAKAKKSVAIVEAEAIGGAEINTRDLPYSKALDFAHTYHKFVTSPAVSQNSCHFNLPTLTATIDKSITDARNDIISSLNSLGITIIEGFAHFLDSHTIAVDDSEYTAKNFILATGAVLKATEISGLDTVRYLTPDAAIKLHRLPKFVFVVGGGSTGVEIAEYFASLGIGVIIMERGTHLLPREDEDIANLITNYFENDLGITVLTNARVTAITEDYNSKIVVFMNGQSEKMVRVDTIVLATGSEPLLDYGLENAGIEYKRTGIIVDKYFSTTAKNIYAIGDCIEGTDSSTERSILEAHTLVNNLLRRQKTTADYSKIPRIINTSPSIAILGLNERDALARDLRYQKSITYLDSSSHYLKVLTDHSKRTLGTSLIAPDAALTLKIKKLLTK